MDENDFEYADEPALDPLNWEKRSVDDDELSALDDLY